VSRREQLLQPPPSPRPSRRTRPASAAAVDRAAATATLGWARTAIRRTTVSATAVGAAPTAI